MPHGVPKSELQNVLGSGRLLSFLNILTGNLLISRTKFSVLLFVACNSKVSHVGLSKEIMSVATLEGKTKLENLFINSFNDNFTNSVTTMG